jgi:hypothetical protein
MNLELFLSVNKFVKHMHKVISKGERCSEITHRRSNVANAVGVVANIKGRGRNVIGRALRCFSGWQSTWALRIKEKWRHLRSQRIQKRCGIFCYKTNHR